MNLLSLIPAAPDGAVTRSFTLTLPEEQTGAFCTAVSAYTKYDGEEAPTIRFELYTLQNGEEKSVLYSSGRYETGNSSDFSLKSWRIPPCFDKSLRARILVDIPENSKLYLRSFAAEPERPDCRIFGGPRHNAHLGFYGMAPNNTMHSVELAAACGFPACIVVPKVTKDGTFVFIHDDTINATARDENGRKIEVPTRVDELTYSELLKYDFGIYKNEIYKGTKLPLLCDFFALCAKTGMRPMFSTHPALTLPQWQEVKRMLTELGILERFHIKSFGFECLRTAYSVFGDTIDGYTWDNGDPARMGELGIDKTKCRVGIELEYKNMTKEKAAEILSCGYFASVWNVGRINGADYRRMMSYGVTEFTEDFHCSMGMNW